MDQPVTAGSGEPTVLELASGVTVRPMAEGTLAIAGDEPPVVLDALRERIVAVCARTTARDELVEVLLELGEFDETSITGAIEDLVGHGLLSSS